MRLTAIILLSTCMVASANGHTQGISIREKNIPLEKLFREIRKQTGYVFFYDAAVISGSKPVTISVKNVSIEEVLNVSLKGQNLEFSIENKTVTIVKKEIPNADGQSLTTDHSPLTIAPPPIDVKGKITNEAGEPVAGASVKIKGTDVGTSTNENGEFSLNVPVPNAILIISGVNIETTEIAVNARTNISIVAVTRVTSLNEVVINKGYYTVKQRANTGNVSKVTSSDIQKQPVSNPILALAGRMPGVYVQQTTGVSGGSVNIQIRGRNSLRTAGNNPLYVVDGVPYTSAALSSTNTSTTVFGGAGNSPLDYINPSDIEAIEILKDADATAIYGSRGANGVVLITTKKGKIGKAGFDLNVYSGMGKVARNMNLLNTQQYLQMRREAFANDNLNPDVFADPDLLVWDTTRYTNWQKELVGETAKLTNVQGTISGGTANSQLLLSGDYFRESSVFSERFKNEKASVHLSVLQTSDNKKFKTSLSASYTLGNNNMPQTDFYNQAITLPPNAPKLYDSSGNLNWENSTWTNPKSLFLQEYKGKSNNLVANTILSYEILKGLQLKANLGYTNVTLKEVSLIPINSWDPAYMVTTGSTFFATSTIKTWISEPEIEYDRQIGNGRLNFLFGSTFQENSLDDETIWADGFTSDALLQNMKAAATLTLMDANSVDYKYQAFFGRVNYNWKDKYILNVTGRRDGSSRFGPGKQFGNFGAIGGAWIFTNENFIKNSLPFISYGKLRGSIGKTGSDQIPDYQFLSTYSPTSYTYQGNTGLIPNRLSNPNFSWETNKKIEGGLELSFSQDQFFFSFSYYRNRSSNQLVGLSLPNISGSSSIQGNFPAVVQNTGYEVELNSLNLRTTKFKWRTSFNLTAPRNKLISYPNIEGSSYATTYSVGKSLFIQNKYHFLQIDKTNGIYLIEDVDQNGAINSKDKIFLKEKSQKFFGGISNNISYKGFQFDIFFQFVKQSGVLPLNNAPGLFGNQPTIVLNHWQKTGDVSEFGRYTQIYGGSQATSFRNAYINGDKSIVNASFVRLKNVALSWEFPSTILKKVKVQNIRLYTQAQNLFTLTNYEGPDPENQSFQQTPPLRVITAGIQITL